MDEFAQEGLIEFGYHPAHIGMVDQGLNALEHFLYQPHPNAGHSLLRVPGLHLLKIAECGFGEADDHPGHDAISGQAVSWHCRVIPHVLPPGPTDPRLPLA